jgi:hypothetical protein
MSDGNVRDLLRRLGVEIDDSDEPARAQGSDDTERRARESRAARLVTLALEHGIELWHAPTGDAYATIRVGTTRQHWPIASTGFASWLGKLLFDATRGNGRHGQVAGRDDIASATTILAGIAQFDGPAYPVFVRVGAHGEAIYLDLGDETWRAVEITATGWRIVADPPVRFIRPRGLLPLPEPVRAPGDPWTDLRRLINVATENDWRLIVGWLAGVLHPHGPYPIMPLMGEQGTGKSLAARLLRATIDPNVVPLRAEPRDVRDLVISATKSRVLVIDNVSHLQRWLSDALCRLSTGGGHATRSLYTNDEEALFDVKRPVILTSITEVVENGDLLDRALLVHMAPIPEEARRPEAEIIAEFEAIRPAVLGALCDAVAHALRTQAEVRARLQSLPRLADWAIWATAATGALGWGDAIPDALTARRGETNAMALEASPLGPILVRLGSSADGWEGTADELRRACALLAAEDLVPRDAPNRPDEVLRTADRLLTRERGWPRNGRAMRALLDRLAPHLRVAGVTITHARRPGTGDRIVILAPHTKIEIGSSQPSHPSQGAENQGFFRDGRGVTIVTPGGPTVTPTAGPSHPNCLEDQGFVSARDECDGRDDHAPSSLWGDHHAPWDDGDDPGEAGGRCIDCGIALGPGESYRCRPCRAKVYRDLGLQG